MKPKKTKPSMTDWFKAQFGKLPLTDDEESRLREEVALLQGRLGDIEQILKANKVLEESWRVAQYVWNITDADKMKGGW